ncbi:MAG: endonuclease/exonuclease/phosphatase family protein, partial [Candidatus Heimdallarchaeota archaeon]|nr:endonuclease/exonuclease/phosphatase family protein [Candidatus Heimdallarchaeota archaeon]MCK4877267.1 endonuclease/exonuclease/phosphatase family protein [Candidatus Heimdallarchaeota archaeon]
MIDFKDLVRKNYSIIILFSILFLFFLQALSDLVERIYAFALLNLEPDENILGLLFFLSPVVLLFFGKKFPEIAMLIVGEIMIISRLIEPLVTKQGIYILAGLTVGSFLIFLPAFFGRTKDKNKNIGLNLGISLAIAVSLSILFRTFNASIDVSQYKLGQIIGWILGLIASFILFGYFLTEKEMETKAEEIETKASFWKILGLTIGIFSIFVVLWFVFMSPTVISRWTEGDYIGIIVGILSMIAISVTVKMWRPDIINKIKTWMLWVWNGLFCLSLTLTVLVHQLRFPDDQALYPIIAPQTAWFHQIPLALMIISSPIIYLDFLYLTREIITLKPSTRKLGGAFAIGGLYLVVMLFIQILPNLWGYLEPISPGFRDKYWLAFLVPSLLIGLATILVKKESLNLGKIKRSYNSKIITVVILGMIFVGTLIGAFVTAPKPDYTATGKTSLIIMTYNIQQGVNVSGDRNYDGQLELIQSIDPDIIGLQECDPTRISGGNLDVIRYFATKLNMYSYYGPKTVTNTYGCAILSKFPISNAESFFMYSDIEQVGSSQVQITVGSSIFNVFVNHPDGDEDITTVYQQEEMLSRTTGLSNIIFMGDF